MQTYSKKCKKRTEKTFPKTLVPISKNIIKGKLKCVICLSERTFIHEIEDKHDRKSKSLS